MEIQIARTEHLPIIQKIAFDTWPATYGHLMSKEQFSYMMEWMYSIESLHQQMVNGQVFLLAIEQDQCYGFASYETDYQGLCKTKVHKIYILHTAQGKGVGKLLMDSIRFAALEKQNSILTLNVKRDNTAIDFYKRIGFAVTESIDIEIGGGYLMRDFVMEKKIDANA